MRILFTLVKAGLLALLPFLVATGKTVTFGEDWSATFTTPPLLQLLDPLNAVLTLLFGYESAIRVVPTEHDRSLLNGLARLLNEFLENRGTGYVSGKLSSHALAL